MKIKILLLISVALVSCRKSEQEIPSTAGLNVINATVGISAIKVNVTGSPISYKNTTSQVNFGASAFYYAFTGKIPVTVVASADTTKLLFNQSVDFNQGIYTMYMAGDASKNDVIFVRETNLPFIKTDITRPPSVDSVVNVRFVNLSPNSPALKINIRNSTTNEVNNFTYKSIGNWKAFDNKAVATTNYIFEIRDEATNIILATYTFAATATNRFKNVALVLKGLVGGTGTTAFSVQVVNYF